MQVCRLRALWVLNSSGDVCFSRRFPTVEREWAKLCSLHVAAGDSFIQGSERESSLVIDPPSGSPETPKAEKPEAGTGLPFDSNVAAAFLKRQKEQSCQKDDQMPENSDWWVDDPMTNHVISLRVGDEVAACYWPVVVHRQGLLHVLVLPLVQPRQVEAYQELSKRRNCGGGSHPDSPSLSSLLMQLPAITGAFLVAQAIGAVLAGETVEPESTASTAVAVGTSLLDSLAGTFSMSRAAAKPAALQQPTTGASSPVTGHLRPAEKEALRNFIASAMPFGTPLDLNAAALASIRSQGFTAADVPPGEQKQPGWKPYLHRGRQRLLLTVRETVHAALYDREAVPDVVTVSGEVECRAELEGLPDVTVPLVAPESAALGAITVHPCVQAPEVGSSGASLCFSPPLGAFQLARYQAKPSLTTHPPPVKGFYQLQMVSPDEGAFLIKLKLMDGYRKEITLDHCSLTLPFPLRRVASLEGTPTQGSVTIGESSIDWKIVTPGGRGYYSKSLDVSFPGTVKFAPLKKKAPPQDTPQPQGGSSLDYWGDRSEVEDGDPKQQGGRTRGVEGGWNEPFTREAYDYAKASFRLVGGSCTGTSVDLKKLVVYPAVKPAVESSCEVVSGEYLLFNTLGRCPKAAPPP